MPISTIKNESSHRMDQAAGLPVSKGAQWTGWALTILATLFMLFDAAGKLAMPSFVVDAFKRLGVPTGLGVGIGTLLIACTLLYAIPRTAVLGAVLLTGFLGGAVAIQLRAGSPAFETVFPVLFGVLTWAGIYFRDSRLRRVFPVRR